MGQHSCVICKDKVACRAIDEELAQGMTYAALARLMTLRGFEVSAPTVSQHAKHRMPVAPPGIATRKKDLALLVRDKVYDRLQQDGMDEMLLLDKNLQGAVNVGLKAEAIIDKREARADDKRQAIEFAKFLLGGAASGYLAPPELRALEDGSTVEGEFEEVDDG